MTGYFQAAPRPLAPDDAESVRALVLGALGITPYVDRALELIQAAEAGDPESRALVIARDGTTAALALFGPVAGSEGTWHLSLLLIAPRVAVREVGGVMVDGVLAAIRAAEGRLLVAELPADPAIGASLSLLRARGFKQEARIPDFYREGVALLFLRRDL